MGVLSLLMNSANLTKSNLLLMSMGFVFFASRALTFEGLRNSGKLQAGVCQVCSFIKPGLLSMSPKSFVLGT